jgi:hypothetical protein
MKYRDLLRELKSLSDEQLDQDVRHIGPEFCRNIDSLWTLGEDWVDEGYGDGIVPRSDYESDPDADIDACTIIPKGTVFLFTEGEK